MITHSDIYALMRTLDVQPKFPGYCKALEYTCIDERQIPEILDRIKVRMKVEGFFRMNPSLGAAVCRHAVLCGLNALCQWQRNDGKFSDSSRSLAVIDFSYTPDQQPGQNRDGHNIIGFIVARGADGLAVVWADLINGCRIIALTANELTYPTQWSVLT